MTCVTWTGGHPTELRSHAGLAFTCDFNYLQFYGLYLLKRGGCQSPPTSPHAHMKTPYPKTVESSHCGIISNFLCHTRIPILRGVGGETSGVSAAGGYM